MRGRKPAPTSLKIANGVRKSRINTAEPVFQRGIPEPPPSVTGRALEIWNYYGAMLDSSGVMTLADRDALV